MRYILLLPLGLLTSAASTPDKNAAKVEAALKGLTPGPAKQCLSVWERRNSERHGDIILFRINRRLIYRSQLTVGCSSPVNDDDYVVTQTPTTQLCAGDIIRLVDHVTNIDTGGCAYGPFVPYRRP